MPAGTILAGKRCAPTARSSICNENLYRAGSSRKILSFQVAGHELVYHRRYWCHRFQLWSNDCSNTGYREWMEQATVRGSVLWNHFAIRGRSAVSLAAYVAVLGSDVIWWIRNWKNGIVRNHTFTNNVGIYNDDDKPQYAVWYGNDFKKPQWT